MRRREIESHLSAGELEAIELSAKKSMVRPGMSAAERLDLLTRPADVIPPRRVNVDDTVDPFGLLEQQDTYEVLAGHIFAECEGIYHHLVKYNPEVAAQFKKSRKSKGEKTIAFPEIGLSEIYNYGVLRSEAAGSVHYLFHRTDKGYEENGFRVIKYSNGHTVLKNLQVDETPPDDPAYYQLLNRAQKWVYDYAMATGIDLGYLRNLAKTNIEPLKLSARAMKFGKSTVKTALQATGKVLTVETKGKKRRPRVAAAAVIAALMPISAHEVAAQGLVNTAAGIIAPSPGPNPQAEFDKLKLNLPASSQMALGAPAARVEFVPNLKLAIQNGAPLQKIGALTTAGQIRRITPYYTDSDLNWSGLYKGECEETGLELPQDIKAVRIVNADAAVAGDLTARASNNGINVCNHAGDIDSSVLQEIYIEPVR